MKGYRDLYHPGLFNNQLNLTVQPSGISVFIEMWLTRPRFNRVTFESALKTHKHWTTLAGGAYCRDMQIRLDIQMYFRSFTSVITASLLCS